MKKFVLASIMIIALMVWVDFAANPSFDILPASWSVLKLHCNYDFNVRLNAWWQNYNAFDATVKFNSWEVLVIHKSVNYPFVDNIAGFVSSWYLYRSYGALSAGQKSSLDSNPNTWWFKTISNITGTLLEFSNINWGSVVFGSATTDDGITVNWFDVSSADILVDVYNASYSFDMLPCIVDVNSPTFTSSIPSNGSRFISSGQRASLLIYDWRGTSSVVWPAPLSTNSTIHYRYSGLNNVLSNYQSSPSSVDNQEWVNSWTIKATISCPTCNSFGWPYVLSWNDLNIALWTGDASHNRYTWNSKDRGYTLYFDPPAPYEIEKLVTVSYQAVDNPNENGLVNTGNYTISFNAPIVPIITSIYPIASSTFVDWKKTKVFKLYFYDDRAGVDTWTIQITIPTIMSWAEVLLTGYTYSGSDLNITLSWWNVWLGNAGSYWVEFNPKRDFPSNTVIGVTWSVVDLAWSIWNLSITFTTRPSCEFWWCNEIFNVIVMDWIGAGIFDFSWSLLVVTGTDINSPYPYLTWDNMDVLMCGLPYTGTVIDANRDILDTSNNVINWLFYTWTELYITWLNFVIENWVIIVQ